MLIKLIKPDPPLPADQTCANCGLDKSPDSPNVEAVSSGGKRIAGSAAILREARLDPFCSTDCCKTFHGLITERERREILGRRKDGKGGPNPNATCKGCGCRLDSKTPGCFNCSSRHYQRARKLTPADPLDATSPTR